MHNLHKVYFAERSASNIPQSTR